MVIIPIKEGDNIEKSLKIYKRKIQQIGVVREVRKRQAFNKPSEVKRKKREKAVYVQALRQQEELL